MRDAFIALDTTKIYPDGVTYGDKQEEIHKSRMRVGRTRTRGPAFSHCIVSPMYDRNPHAQITAQSVAACQEG